MHVFSKGKCRENGSSYGLDAHLTPIYWPIAHIQGCNQPTVWVHAHIHVLAMSHYYL